MELQQFQIGLSLGNTIVHTYFQSRKLKENSLFDMKERKYKKIFVKKLQSFADLTSWYQTCAVVHPTSDNLSLKYTETYKYKYKNILKK